MRTTKAGMPSVGISRSMPANAVSEFEHSSTADGQTRAPVRMDTPQQTGINQLRRKLVHSQYVVTNGKHPPRRYMSCCQALSLFDYVPCRGSGSSLVFTLGHLLMDMNPNLNVFPPQGPPMRCTPSHPTCPKKVLKGSLVQTCDQI